MAMILGDLPRARTAAQAIAGGGDAPTGLPANAARYATEMRDHAREVVAADNIAGASFGTARMAGACGNCHHAMGAGPHYSVLTRPVQGTGQVPLAMQLHYWAADRMWEGLIGPSDSAWAAGSLALADVPQYQSRIHVSAADSADVQALALRLHQLAVRAQLASTGNAREEVYGEFLETCATCHQITKGGPR
jgi:cytochrome c553